MLNGGSSMQLNADELMEPNISIQGAHYPWGIYIGEFRHPARGMLFPAVIPNDQCGLLIRYDESCLDNAIHICEDISVHFVLGLSKVSFPHINILDKSLSNLFLNIMQLNDKHIISKFTNNDSIDKFIHQLSDIVRERSYNIIDENIKNIYQYNEQVDERAQESYILNLVNLNHYAISCERIDLLEELLRVSYLVGVKFIFYFDYSQFEYFINGVNDNKKENIRHKIDKLLDRLPTLILKEKDIFFGDNLNIFDNLRELINKNKLTIELSRRDDNHHIFNMAVSCLRDIYKFQDAHKPKSFLKIDVGVSPNGKEKCYFELGAKNQAYHAFMIGMNGTGKTTLLDHIIKGIASQYTPDEAELYLFDYKEGVEFKKYSALPHSRVVMLDNSQINTIRDVIDQFHYLIKERGKLFKRYGAKNIDEYNKLTNISSLSRCYLIIDELQKLFEHPNSSYIENKLIDLAKRGRAFGLHMIMSTQTLTGYTINTELLTQFKMRISFTVDFSDSMKIFMIGNESPIYLNPFEFILNDGMGIKQNNRNILMNKPISDSVIFEIGKKYAHNNYECLVIEENEEIIIEENYINDNRYIEENTKNDYVSDVFSFGKERDADFVAEIQQAVNLPSVETDWEEYFNDS